MRTVFRLSETLRRYKEQLGSFERLSAKIREANLSVNREGRTLDRRKLKRIIAGGQFSLTSQDILALDTFLQQFGEGLTELPLLEQREGGLKELAHYKDIIFFLPATVRDDRHDLSCWDVRAMALLQRSIQRDASATAPFIRDTLRPKSIPRGDKVLSDYSELKNPSAAICCFGTPDVLHVSEIVLTEMFGVEKEAFRRPTAASRALPFYFVKRRKEGYNSRFMLGPEDLHDERLARELSDLRTRVLQVDNEVLISRWSKKRFKDYGVVATRKRPDGQLQFVLAGLSGPGTTGAAQALIDHDHDLVQIGQERVVYAIAEIDVSINTQIAKGDRREVLGVRILGDVRAWPER